MDQRVTGEPKIDRKALSLALREASQEGKISRNSLLAKRGDVKKAEVDRALSLLCQLQILEKAGSANTTCYQMSDRQWNPSTSFLILEVNKRTNVSSSGHRAVRVQAEIMAIRTKVTERRCGSIIWTEESLAPKIRLGPVMRVDPMTGTSHLPPEFEIVKQKNNDMVFQLNFQPPLCAGEMVKYGFYVWTPSHYSLSRNEALNNYHDEWIREGISINDPTLMMTIIVKLPSGYTYQRAYVEKDPVLTIGGPNVPGAVLTSFAASQRELAFSSRHPPIGHYFVSWIPPE